MMQGTTRNDQPFVILYVREDLNTTTTAFPLYVRRDRGTVLITDLEPYQYQPPPIALLNAEVFDDLRRKRAQSKQALAQLVADAQGVRPTSIAARARFGFQQAARLPCYRGTRTR